MVKASSKLIDLIVKFEGLKLKPYFCSAGIQTIGVGHVMKPGINYDNLTKKQALDLLAQDLQLFEKGVARQLQTLGIREIEKIPQNQIDALISFAFNVGLGNLARSTLLKKYADNDLNGTAKEFLRWNKAAGQVVEGLAKRRLVEAAIFINKRQFILDFNFGVSQTNIRDALKLYEGYTNE